MAVTLLDIAKANASDRLVGIVEDNAKYTPELDAIFARTIKGISYDTLVRSALPSRGFRAANEGVANSTSVWANRHVDTFIADASFNLDKAVADGDEDGWQSAVGREAMGNMKAVMQAVASQMYYGEASDQLGATKGFPGLVDSVLTANDIDNGGGSGADTTSVWAVADGLETCGFVFGNGGNFDEGEVLLQQVTDSNSNIYWAYCQMIMARLGFYVNDTNSVARLKRVKTTLTDANLATLVSKFPVGLQPTRIMMNRSALALLQSGRTATNATGAPAPRPTEYEGIPIVVTDSILSTETDGTIA